MCARIKEWDVNLGSRLGVRHPIESSFPLKDEQWTNGGKFFFFVNFSGLYHFYHVMVNKAKKWKKNSKVTNTIHIMQNGSSYVDQIRFWS